MISWAKQQYKTWKDARFLRRHGCDNWQQYHYRFDPDYNIRATRLKDYYHGYPYWHVFDNHKHFCYELIYDFGPGGYRYRYHDISDWCGEKLKHKHRMDILRVMRAPSTANQWAVNELGGSDYLFVAFKDERDYTWFMLRWS